MSRSSFVYAPGLDPETGVMMTRKYVRTYKMGIAAVKSGYYFLTYEECEMFINMFKITAKEMRTRREKYSHICVEFIKKDLGQPTRKNIYKPKLKDI